MQLLEGIDAQTISSIPSSQSLKLLPISLLRQLLTSLRATSDVSFENSEFSESDSVACRCLCLARVFADRTFSLPGAIAEAFATTPQRKKSMARFFGELLSRNMSVN